MASMSPLLVLIVSVAKPDRGSPVVGGWPVSTTVSSEAGSSSVQVQVPAATVCSGAGLNPPSR